VRGVGVGSDKPEFAGDDGGINHAGLRVQLGENVWPSLTAAKVDGA
jgi:hypothetical protein